MAEYSPTRIQAALEKAHRLDEMLWQRLHTPFPLFGHRREQPI